MAYQYVTLIVVPLPGVVYSSGEEALEAWKRGDTFTVVSAECRGKSFTIKDVPGETVKIRRFDGNPASSVIFDPSL